MSPSEHLRKILTGICLLGAPLALLVGALVNPEEETDGAHQLAVIAGAENRWYAAHVIYLVSLVLLVGAIIGLAHLLHERRPGLAMTGGGLTIVGALATAALVGMSLVAWKMVTPVIDLGLGPAPSLVENIAERTTTMAALYDRVADSAGVIPILVLTLALPAGLIVLGAGLAAAQVVARWTAVAIGAGALLIGVGFPGELSALVLAGAALLLVGLGTVGLTVLVEPDEDWAHTPSFRGFRGVRSVGGVGGVRSTAAGA